MWDKVYQVGTQNVANEMVKQGEKDALHGAAQLASNYISCAAFCIPTRYCFDGLVLAVSLSLLLLSQDLQMPQRLAGLN